MCLSVQGEVLRIEGAYAWVRSLGQPVRVSIAAVPAVQPGEWVLIRAGMALDVLSAEEARELDAFSQEFLALFEQDPEGSSEQALQLSHHVTSPSSRSPSVESRPSHTPRKQPSDAAEGDGEQ